MTSLANKILSTSVKDIFGHFNRKRAERSLLRNRESLITKYLTTTSCKKLHLGCSTVFLEGWLNTDVEASGEIAFLDAAAPYPFVNETFDFIFCEHLFEHLTLQEQMTLLQECHRVLKREGVFRLAMPSMDFLFHLYSNSDDPQNRDYVKWAVNEHTGLQAVKKLIPNEQVHPVYVINNFFRDWGHQSLHNLESLTDLIQTAGFSRVVPSRIGKSTFPELNGLEKHGTIIPAEFNEKETMVVEIQK